MNRAHGPVHIGSALEARTSPLIEFGCLSCGGVNLGDKMHGGLANSPELLHRAPAVHAQVHARHAAIFEQEHGGMSHIFDGHEPAEGGASL